MYLKVQTEEGWKVFGEIQNVEYSFVDWDWERYCSWCGDVNYSVGPVSNENEWKRRVGTGSFVCATLTLKNGDCRLCAWDTVAYVLNDEGKTIEAIGC